MPYAGEMLVCTCDAYSDTWEPFFTLLAAHWPGAGDLSIILTTEEAEYSHPGLRIRCARTGARRGGGQRPWSERILHSLELCHDPIIFQMMDDYFLSGPARPDVVADLAGADLGEWSSVGLTAVGDWAAHPAGHPLLIEVDRSAPYLVSTQASLWRVERLAGLLRPHESVWEFELMGSLRAAREGHRMLRVANGAEDALGGPIVPYPRGGVITQGRWRAPWVVEMMAEYGLALDFGRRGFLDDDGPPVHSRPRLYERPFSPDTYHALWQRARGGWRRYLSLR